MKTASPTNMEIPSPKRINAKTMVFFFMRYRCHSILDWNWDEDRSYIRTKYGPENVSRL